MPLNYNLDSIFLRVGSAENSRLAALCSNKHGMCLTPAVVLNFGQMSIGSTKTASFLLTNSSPYPHCLKSVRIQGHQTVANFTITHNQESKEMVTIFTPQQSESFAVKVRGLT